MDRRFPANGRLGLLAASVVMAALALTLSGCGGPARSASSAQASSSTPPPSNSRSASASNSDSGDSSGSPDASVTDFCLTWRLTAPYFNQDFAVLGSDPSYDYSTEAVFLVPTINGVESDLGTAAQQAPLALNADMATLSSYWIQVESDFQAQTDADDQVTVGQVKAYILANPPAQSGNVQAAVQDLSSYLATTCSVTLDA